VSLSRSGKSLALGTGGKRTVIIEALIGHGLQKFSGLNVIACLEGEPSQDAGERHPATPKPEVVGEKNGSDLVGDIRDTFCIDAKHLALFRNGSVNGQIGYRLFHAGDDIAVLKKSNENQNLGRPAIVYYREGSVGIGSSTSQRR